MAEVLAGAMFIDTAWHLKVFARKQASTEPCVLFFSAVFVVLFKHNLNMHASHLLILFAVQPGIGIGDSDGQLRCSFHNGFSVLGGNIVSNLSTIRLVAHQKHLQLLDVVDQKLPEAAR